MKHRFARFLLSIILFGSFTSFLFGAAEQIKTKQVSAEKKRRAEPQKKAADEVSKDEPKEIKIPEFPEETGDLFEQFGVRQDKPSDRAFIDLIKSMEGDELIPLKFSDIPIVNKLPLPKKIKSFFDNIVMRVPEIQFDEKGGISIEGQVDLYKTSVWSRVMISSDMTGRAHYSVAVRMPKGWKFSDTFPKIKGFDPKTLDLLELEDAWLVLSSSRYKDPKLEKEVREGLNFFARVLPAGPLFEKLNKLLRGQLKKATTLEMRGVIGLDPRLIGTMLSVELPSGITFTKWLKTAPLSLLFVVEERITQVATVSVLLRGGLNVLLPLQKKPVDFKMTGKYTFPEDFEFYGQMDGWLRNFPIKGVHIGNLKLGIITDLSLILETAGLFGWVAGFNLAGSLGIMDSVTTVKAKGALSGDTGIGDLTFIVEGTTSLKDGVSFWLTHAQDVARLFKKVNFKDKILAFVPNLAIEDFRLAFVPRETFEEGKKIEVKVGKINIFGLTASGWLSLEKDGVRGGFRLPEIVIGKRKKPLFYVSGIGKGKDRGPVLELVLTKEQQFFHSDILWGTSLFGGLHRRSKAFISPAGLELRTTFKLGGLIYADLAIRASLLGTKSGPKNFTASITLDQRAQDKVSEILGKAARELMVDLQEDLERIKQQALEGFQKGIFKEGEKALRLISKLDASIKRKKASCDKTFSKGAAKIFRPGCYALKGVTFDYLRRVTVSLHKNVTLKVVMEGGKAVIKVAAGVAKETTRTVGKVLKFLSAVVKNVINVRRFEAEADFYRLLKGKPFILKYLDMKFLGFDVLVKGLEFSPLKTKEFIMELFEQLAKNKNIKKVIGARL